ncbi:MAG: hypothetical protein ACLQBJ_11370 [Bryobacteraceae bacterium]
MAKLSCWLGAAVICGSWATATAQNAISAKAGLVQVADGEVLVNDKPIQTKIAVFTDLKDQDLLRTGEGRTEVLLTPGAFLRMGDNSSFRMVSTRLSDVRLEVAQGEALVEITEMIGDNAINVRLGNADFELTRGGLFAFDADAVRLRVYKGEATAVLPGEKNERVKEGRQLTFTGNAWTQSGFDTKETDALYRWSQRRAEDVAVANVSAARQSGNGFNSYSDPIYGAAGYGWGGYGLNGFGYGGLGYGGFGYGGMGYGLGFGGNWMFNPYFGMYTFLPFGGTAWSPFGYAFYTPITVMPVYANAPVVQPVTPGVPGKPGKVVTPAGNVVRTPAFTSAAALHTSAVTRGAVVSHGWSGGSGLGGYGARPASSGSTAGLSSLSTSAGSAHAGAPSGGGHSVR